MKKNSFYKKALIASVVANICLVGCVLFIGLRTSYLQRQLAKIGRGVLSGLCPTGAEAEDGESRGGDFPAEHPACQCGDETRPGGYPREDQALQCADTDHQQGRGLYLHQSVRPVCPGRCDAEGTDEGCTPPLPRKLRAMGRSHQSVHLLTPSPCFSAICLFDSIANEKREKVEKIIVKSCRFSQLLYICTTKFSKKVNGKSH